MWLKDLISNTIKSWIIAQVTREKILNLINTAFGNLDAFVLSTPMQIDDAALDDIETKFTPELRAAFANYLVLHIEDMLNTTAPAPEPSHNVLMMGSGAIGADVTGPKPLPHALRGWVQMQMANKIRKERHCTRRQATEFAKNQINDDLIRQGLEAQGVPVGQLGDGHILQWLLSNPDAVFGFITKLLAILLPLLAKSGI